MKKQKISELIKNKSFYLVLLTGLCAVFVIAFVYVNLRSTNSGNSLVDLNESSKVANKDETKNQKASGNNSKQQNGSNQSTYPEAIANAGGDKKVTETDPSLLENDIVSEKTKDKIKTDSKAKSANNKKADVKKADSDKNKTVAAMNAATAKLSFAEDDGLLWPVTGDVLLNYSMDHVVYFATLGEYKCNPAILIGAKVGTKIVSAAKGIVTAIENDDETGLTITMEIGSDYSVIYGQLKDVSVKVGDLVEEGATLGMVAKPSNYYTVEGSNLYFEVINDKEPVNPMLLLR